MDGAAGAPEASTPTDAAQVTQSSPPTEVPKKRGHVGADATNRCVYLPIVLDQRLRKRVAELKEAEPQKKWSTSTAVAEALELWLKQAESAAQSSL